MTSINYAPHVFYEEETRSTKSIWLSLKHSIIILVFTDGQIIIQKWMVNL